MASGIKGPTRTLSEHQAILLEYGLALRPGWAGHYAPTWPPDRGNLHDCSDSSLLARRVRRLSC